MTLAGAIAVIAPIDVYLRDTLSGDARVYSTDGCWDNGEFEDSIWCEGNYACDCNRSLFLWNWDDAKALPCGDGRIVIDRITRADTGETVYAE